MIQEGETKTMQEETTERGLFSINKNNMQEETKERGLFSNNNIVLFGNSKPNKPCKPFNKPHKMGYNYTGYQAHYGPAYQAPHGGYQSQHEYSHAYTYQAQPPIAHPGYGYSHSAVGYSHSGGAHAYPPAGYPVPCPPGPTAHMANHQEEYYNHEESTEMYESSGSHGYGHGGYGGYGMYRKIK